MWLSGVDSLIMTKLDVLSGFSSIKICTGYKINNKVIDTMPSTVEELAKVEPVYEEIPGWEITREDISTFDDLPKNARLFVRRVEELLGTPISIASVGPKRENYLSHSGKEFSPF